MEARAVDTRGDGCSRRCRLEVASGRLPQPELPRRADRAGCGDGLARVVAGQLGVGFMDPVAVLAMTTNPEVARVAHEVRERLDRVKAALVNGAASLTQH